MKICLIITTYNWPDALELSLQSIVRQRKQPDEVIIADDGSRQETRDLIDSYKGKIKNLKHAWHEDTGYQRAKILNKSIMMSESDFIITTDQDCILDKNFILDYSLQAEEGFYISGYRINLRERLTKRLVRRKRLPNLHEIFAETKWNVKHQIRARFMWNRTNRYISGSSNGTYGCNMGFFKKDVMAINGYNEDFVGWGPEDSEMTQRLMNNGIGWKRVYYSAILYHMYHPILCRKNADFNIMLLRKALKEKIIFVPNGILKTA